MRILVLSKRQYTGKDLLDDEFGRLHEIPYCLACMGHDVAGLCLSYRKRNEYADNPKSLLDGKLQWWSKNIAVSPTLGLLAYFKLLDHIIESFLPEIIWGVSDSFHAIIASYVAKKHNIPYVIDLYDNFESFKATHIPGIFPAYINALKQAQGITCVSDTLRQYIDKNYETQGGTITLVNAINSSLFYPRNKSICRQELGLPEDAILIGTAGALAHSRGIQTLYDAFEDISKRRQSIHLVLAGPGNRGHLPTSPHNRIHYLGVLPHDRIHTVYASLDLAVICNVDSQFGRYCFPQKFYEILACNTPLLSASVGALKDILIPDHQDCLYPVDNAPALADAIEHQLAVKYQPGLAIPSWKSQADVLISLFQKIVVNL